MIINNYHYFYLNPTHSANSLSINGILFAIIICIIVVDIIICIVVAPSAHALIPLIINSDTPASVSLVILSITLIVIVVA